MAGGYQYQPQDLDAVVAELRDLRRQVDALRGRGGGRPGIVPVVASIYELALPAISVGTFASAAGVDVVVPEDFTVAQVVATATLNVFPTDPGTDSPVLVKVVIAGTGAGLISTTTVRGSGFATASNTFASLLTDLAPGSNLHGDAMCQSSFAMPGCTFEASITMSVLFLR